MSAGVLIADLEPPECPGAGLCHGCLKWCDACEDVAHVCDARLRGERCDEHPVPPSVHTLRRERAAAEHKISEARRLLREGQAELSRIVDDENARRAYDAQEVALANAIIHGVT